MLECYLADVQVLGCYDISFTFPLGKNYYMKKLKKLHGRLKKVPLIAKANILTVPQLLAQVNMTIRAFRISLLSG
jgi:hypothetical protein